VRAVSPVETRDNVLRWGRKSVVVRQATGSNGLCERSRFARLVKMSGSVSIDMGNTEISFEARLRIEDAVSVTGRHSSDLALYGESLSGDCSNRCISDEDA